MQDFFHSGATRPSRLLIGLARLAALLAALCTALALTTAPARASTVLEVSMDEMLARAALVFEGRVIASEVRAPQQAGYLRTWLTFEVLDVIVGDYTEPTIELGFAGGRSGGLQVEVSGMNYPQVGDQGVYFVESLDGNMVHPLYGWSQGHFRVMPDSAGVARVTTEDYQPVSGIQNMPIQRSGNFSSGVAGGILQSASSLIGDGIRASDFKDELKARAGELGR